MFVELHAQSAFSFLEGAEQPEALVAEAARLDMGVLALVDRDGLSAAPRFYQAATRAGIRPLIGSELTLRDGARLPLLVEDRDGYRNLSRLITLMKLRAPKGEGALDLEEITPYASGLVCLTGGAQGLLGRSLAAGGHRAARATLERLAGIFGADNCFVEVQRHRERAEERRLQALVRLAHDARLPLVATNQPLYCGEGGPSAARIPGRAGWSGGRALADALMCIREKTTLDAAGRLLACNDERRLKPAVEMAGLFADLPEAVANTGELALRLAFTLKDVGYRFPDYPLPPGQEPLEHLRALAERGARARYGRGPLAAKASRQIAYELDVIGRLDLAGYFLIVWDLVEYCRDHDILVQGRGSAANSAVCYALGITAVDPVGMGLLFERFLSEARGEWPDIDLDLPSGERREDVIQYVYRRYGRLGAAMTANVITYRGRSAARELGKVLDLPADLRERLARLVPIWGYRDPADVLTRHLAAAGCDPAHPRIRAFAALWTRIQDLPRHLGQHSGGMVIAAGRLDDVVPLETATMPGRVVIQWDKEDCAALGIIKVDLLGLRMMSVIQEAIEIVGETGGEIDLAHLPADDPTVYAMLREADTVGVFQVESRAQMATLPRIQPERFYDLVVQVAIIRPGPIVGDMVHPYINRRRGRERVTYPHPSLEPILERTLGVPLFQEQLLRMAMVTAGFTGAEAEELRRAFGFKRSEARMAEVEGKLRAGMARQGIAGDAAEQIVHAITAFALYGFPECVVGETRIVDADTGQRVPIEDIVHGRARVEATFACNDDMKLVKRRITRAMASGSRMVYRLRTALGREIMATAEHPLLTVQGWRALASLGVGDCIATARTLPCPGWAQQAVTWKSIGRTAGVALREIATPGRTKRGYRRGVIERGGRFLQSRELIRLATSDLYWDRILGIEPVGMRETYDLEIEDDHTFVANDIVVHNSHASSFALLAYASAYLKAHHAPAFYAALLNNQPMGFYHPATIVNDARRHGQRILPIDVTRSDWLCTVEDIGDGAFAVRLGLRYVKGLREEVAKALVAARAERPFASATEVALRVCLDRAERETLAAIGAFASLRGTRRQNVWTLAAPPVGPLFATVQSEHPPEAGNGAPAVVPHSPLPEMTEIERLEADYAGTRVTVGRHPMALRRVELARRGVTRAADLARGWPGQRIRVAGSVIVRQRPGTAKGFLFLSLEDETGIANVIVTPQHFERQRLVLVSEPFLLVEGVLQKQDGVVSIKAGRVQPLPPLTNNVASHDFG